MSTEKALCSTFSLQIFTLKADFLSQHPYGNIAYISYEVTSIICTVVRNMVGNVPLPSPQESGAGPEPRAGRWTGGAKELKADRGEAVCHCQVTRSHKLAVDILVSKRDSLKFH